MRVGVVGLGIGRTHVDRYARIAGVELAAVCDVDADLAGRIAAERGCPAYPDATRMLAEARLDAVSICTPPGAHPELTAAAAARGIHVLAEKPMASTVDGCRRMTEACRAAGVVLMIGHKKRFAPPFVRLLELTGPGGALGPIRQVTLRYMHPGASPRRAWFWSEEDGGGPVLENHVHAAYTLGFLVGAAERVYAEGAIRFAEPPEPQPNVAGYTARFRGREPVAGDAIAAVGYGWVGPVPRPLTEEEWYFGCERGVAEVTGPFDNLQRLRWAEREGPDAPVHEENWPDADPFLAELEHFVACVRNGTPPLADGAAGLESVRFCLAVKESIRRGQPVEL